MAQRRSVAPEERAERLAVLVGEHPGHAAGEVLLEVGLVAPDGERGFRQRHALLPQLLARGLSYGVALALASEIMRLENLHGYLRFPGPLPVATIALDYVKRGQAAERFVPREGTSEAVPSAPAGGGGPGADAASAAGPGIAEPRGALALPAPETAPAPPGNRPPPDAPPGADDIPPPDEPPPAARARVPGKTPGKAGKTVRRQAPADPPEPPTEDKDEAAPRPGVAI